MSSISITQELATPQTPVKEISKTMRTFLIVWLGQFVSVIGSSMTGFGLGVYVYQRSGSATDFTLIFLFTMLPRALFAPLAGSLADRWNRRWLMILSDTGAGITTIAAALLLAFGDLALWHIYVIVFINAFFNALQGPAYAASIAQLVPKQHYGRVSGMVQLGEAFGQIAAPVLAGVLISTVGLSGILSLDMITFFFAVTTLMLVRFPAVQASSDHASSEENELSGWLEGWRYLKARPGLLALVLSFSLTNYFVGNAEALLTPLILTYASTSALGTVLSVGGLGMLVGSIGMSIWGGGERKVYTSMGFYGLLGVMVILMGLTSNLFIVAVVLFVAFLSVPLTIGANNAIVMSKVDQRVQGRVFALRIMLNTGAFALAYMTAGPLADQVFVPLVGEEGIATLFIVMGILAMLTAIGGLLYTPLRRVEIDLLDAE